MVQGDEIVDGGKPRHGEAGLTLPEVIAALVILAISLGTLFPLLSDSLRRTGQAEAMAEAGSLAQSLLAGVGAELAIQPGITTGEFPNGYRWSLQIEPYGDGGDQRAWPVAAYTVSAVVAWGDGVQEQSLSLSTLRLAPKEARR
jgi:prepilin-type N-terminal cleavage/methylation domain-containing protein